MSNRLFNERTNTVLLAENRYKTKQRNLALMKFATFYKEQGYDVEYFGQGKKKPDLLNYDYICFSTIFTFHFQANIEAINYLKNFVQDKDKLRVGGVAATLMPEDYYEATGIYPFQGIDNAVEDLKPDYSLFPEHPMKNYSQVFSSRGCLNNCGFCAVGTLEPEYRINKNWKDAIDLNKSKVYIHDNNLTAGDFDHFKDIMDFLKKHNLRVIFDNGFDCRFFTDDHLEEIKGVKFERNGLRFAFDSMHQDGSIQEVLQKCLDVGIPKSKMMVYVLFNYTDTFEEAFYRAEEIRKLGVRPYPQQFRPLDDKERINRYISPNWNKELVKNYRMYWMMPGMYTRYSWEEFLKTDTALR